MDDQILTDIIDEMMRGYEPASGLYDSDPEADFTTSEMINRINEFYPSAELTEKFIYEQMKSRGYKYGYICGTLKWLLKEKSK